MFSDRATKNLEVVADEFERSVRELSAAVEHFKETVQSPTVAEEFSLISSDLMKDIGRLKEMIERQGL